MALVGNMINEAISGNPSSVNYAMFVSVFSLLSLFYLVAATARESFDFHPIITLALDLINALLFFIGGVVLAAKLRAHSCGNVVSTIFVAKVCPSPTRSIALHSNKQHHQRWT